MPLLCPKDETVKYKARFFFVCFFKASFYFRIDDYLLLGVTAMIGVRSTMQSRRIWSFLEKSRISEKEAQSDQLNQVLIHLVHLHKLVRAQTSTCFQRGRNDSETCHLKLELKPGILLASIGKVTIICLGKCCKMSITFLI